MSFQLLLAAYTIIAGWLNAAFDSPHQPESRPDFAEVCYFEDRSAVWIEIAGPESLVCDETGQRYMEHYFNVDDDGTRTMTGGDTEQHPGWQVIADSEQ